MSEIQKIAIGLLGMSHPEIYRFRSTPAEPVTHTVEAATLKPSQAPRPVQTPQSAQASPPMQAARPTQGSKPTRAARALRGLKFAFAALVAGGRVIPLGDNGRLTQELGEYGAHLKGC